RFDAPFREQLSHLLGKTEIDELTTGDVDRDAEVSALRSPGGALAESRIENVARQRPDQPGLLGQGYELIGLQQPAVRMLPARQRFDPAHLARRRIGFGLVVDDDLVALECAPQLSDERE